MHPLVKGTWALVRAVHEIARVQPYLDKRVVALVDAMDTGSKVAKEYAPTKGRHVSKDSVVRDMLREIIEGANIVKVYCEKRPKGVNEIRFPSLHKLMMSLSFVRAFGLEDNCVRSRAGGGWLFSCPLGIESKTWFQNRARVTYRNPSYGELDNSER